MTHLYCWSPSGRNSTRINLNYKFFFLFFFHLSRFLRLSLLLFIFVLLFSHFHSLSTTSELWSQCQVSNSSGNQFNFLFHLSRFLHLSLLLFIFSLLFSIFIHCYPLMISGPNFKSLADGEVSLKSIKKFHPGRHTRKRVNKNMVK